MKFNRTSNTTAALTHPLTLVAACLLLLNATMLQHTWPNWLTGKLGDATWMILAPIVAATMLTALLPVRYRSQRAIAQLAIGSVALGFVLVKTMLPINTWVQQLFFNFTNSQLKLVLDPTDLLVLPTLLITWNILTKPTITQPQLPKQLAAILCITVALVADAPGPQMLGVVCVVSDTGSIRAITETRQGSYFGTSVRFMPYVSIDGGTTWNPGESSDKSPCTPVSGSVIEVTDPNDPDIQYLLRASNGVYRSNDGGATFTRELQLQTGFYNAYFDVATGRMFVSAGIKGVAIREPDGTWRVVAVG